MQHSKRPQYAPHTAFRAELVRRVNERLESSNLDRHGGARLTLKSLVILAWLVGSYLLLLLVCEQAWQVVLGAVSIGLAAAGVGFNIQHDGGHGSHSRHRWCNALAARSLDLIGGSSYIWHFKHNIVHHHFTNLQGVDEDLEAGPYLRLAPGQRRRAIHRVQHWYVWFLYCLLPSKWQFYDDYRDLIRGAVGSQAIPRPGAKALAVLLGFKLSFLLWAIALPLWLGRPLGGVLLAYGVAAATLGVTLATVFQLAHCVDGCHVQQRPPQGERVGRSWAKHQLATTANFAPHSRLLTWFVGGLNYQVEHHLFPRISHVHYPALALVIQQVCREFGVTYRTHPTLGRALRAHVRYLRRMGLVPSAA